MSDEITKNSIADMVEQSCTTKAEQCFKHLEEKVGSKFSEDDKELFISGFRYGFTEAFELMNMIDKTVEKDLN